ncbi:hypothetical protein [Arthrobacter oryzae]|uniref:hypothetical protein n=1 Tax=Arthrobacter oryzae TaxID=409290 RepID=UPI001606B949|nr:hypothetical protein [Arthrobacter oryzae]
MASHPQEHVAGITPPHYSHPGHGSKRTLPTHRPLTTGTPSPAIREANTLTAILWQGRELLGELLVLHNADGTGTVQRPDRNWTEIRDHLRLSGLNLNIAVSALADKWNVAGDADLRTLARLAPEPWQYIFESHLSGLMSLVAHRLPAPDTAPFAAEDTHPQECAGPPRILSHCQACSTPDWRIPSPWLRLIGY